MNTQANSQLNGGSTKWTFRGFPMFRGEQKRVFEVQDIFWTIDGVMQPIRRLAFSFRSEWFSDAMAFLGDSVKRENRTVLASAFAHLELDLGLGAEVHILVQSTTKTELTEEIALEELHRIMALRGGTHVMIETVQPADKYTGERFQAVGKGEMDE